MRVARALLRGAAGLLGAFGIWLLAAWPPPVWFETHWPRETAFQEMRRRGGVSEGRRGPLRQYHPVPLDSIAPEMADAAMAGEDQRFEYHHGIDWVNLRHALGYPRDAFQWGSARDRADLRAAIGQAWVRREKLRGASTITQQLAKNLYLSPSRNPLRKIKEAITAWRLEAALPKDRIMELYLNTVELGPEVWGVEAASRRYFGHDAATLSLEEAAELAGALPFPLRSNPALHPARMLRRQQLILLHLRGVPVLVPPDTGLDVSDTLIPAPVLDTIAPAVPESVPQLLPGTPRVVVPPPAIPDTTRK